MAHPRTVQHRGGQLDVPLPDDTHEPLERSTSIIVSNRGPVEFHQTDDCEIARKRGIGGVIPTMSTTAPFADAIWVACAMTPTDRVIAEEMRQRREALLTTSDLPRFRLRFLVPTTEAYRGSYNWIANPSLRFLQHFL